MIKNKILVLTLSILLLMISLPIQYNDELVIRSRGENELIVHPKLKFIENWVPVELYIEDENAGTRASENYGVLIGINDYPGTGSDLTSCISDINSMHNILVNTYNWNPNNIHMLTNSAGTKTNIVQELQWLASKLGPNSQAIFEFSGHGEQGRLMAYDDWVYDDTIANEIKKFPNDKTLIIIDACFSGANYAFQSIKNTIALMACGANEYAGDPCFTPAFVQGLGTTQYGEVEDAYQYAYNKIKNYQHPVIWDNIPGKLSLGIRPPEISPPIPDLSADEDNSIVIDLTQYESDPVYSGIDLKWTVTQYSKTVIAKITGENSDDDIITFIPVKDFFGTTNVTFTLKNGAGVSTSQKVKLTWKPVNDLPNVTKLDALKKSIIRSQETKLLVYGFDPDNPYSQLTCEVEYMSPSGSWTSLNNISFITNHWEVVFVAKKTFELGNYSFRARLKDISLEWSEYLVLKNLISVENSLPEVTSISLSSIDIHRLDNLSITVFGSDIEDEQALLRCEIDYKPSNSTFWLSLPNAQFSTDRWVLSFTIPANSDLGNYNLKAKLFDEDGGGGFFETNFFVLNALPVVSKLEFEALSVFRCAQTKISIYGWDVEDSMSSLLPEIQYSFSLEDWEDFQAAPEFTYDHFEVIFKADKDSKVGFYSFRCRLRDLSGGWGSWFYTNATLEVKNNPPFIKSIKFPKSSIYRKESITIEVYGEDVEEAELKCELEYGSRDSWIGIDVKEALVGWTAVFTPNIDMKCDEYKFRARLSDELCSGQWFFSSGLNITNNKPKAVFSIPKIVNEGTKIEFDGRNSSDIESSHLSYFWDFGDGSKEVGEKAIHSYLKYGSYKVKLRVIDEDNGENVSESVLIVNSLPKVKINWKQRAGMNDYTIEFYGDAKDIDGKIVSYSWDFDLDKDTNGDRIKDNDIDAIGGSPVHKYKNPGNFRVKLMVKDSNGGEISSIVTIEAKQVSIGNGVSLILLLFAIIIGIGFAFAVIKKRKGAEVGIQTYQMTRAYGPPEQFADYYQYPQSQIQSYYPYVEKTESVQAVYPVREYGKSDVKQSYLPEAVPEVEAKKVEKEEKTEDELRGILEKLDLLSKKK
ncbi:MAG: PKD domain-containing protein [Candidatus Thermoplasmatota archaeon]